MTNIKKDKLIYKKIAVRYPPSPTGELHIGNIRVFLFNYLFAKHHENLGSDISIFMRFEDTDKERSKKMYEKTALDTLDALGITYTDGPFRQSERGALYEKAITKLIDKGLAYEAEKSTHGKDGEVTNVIRFKNPNKKVTFTDVIRGDITIDTSDFGDFVIARSLKDPLYHLTVVVDDMGMNITHIIRGEDHITSTPRQILLIKALEGTVPNYAHLPLVIGENKKKLSKRFGAVTYKEFYKEGYLPEAIVNYLALLGWSEKNDREFYTMDELITAFTLENVSSSPAMFSYDKLASVSAYYISKLGKEVFEEKVEENITDKVKKFLDNSSDDVRRVVIEHVIRERVQKFSDVVMVCESDLVWLDTVCVLDIREVVWKKSNTEDTIKHFGKIISLFDDVDDGDWQNAKDFSEEKSKIKESIWNYASEVGRGEVLWPLRYALTGEKRSPDPFTVAFILGKEETILRVHNAKKLLEDKGL